MPLMVFRPFDRKLFVATQATASTAATITTATDFIETIEPTYTITPLMFERTPKSSSMTAAVQTVPGSAKTSPVSQIEISFGVELSGPATGLVTGTAPPIGKLLKCCGMAEYANIGKYAVTSTTYAAGPFFHNENIDGHASSYAAMEGIAWSNNTYGDADFLCQATYGTLGNVGIKSQLSGAVAEASATTAGARIGVGYAFSTAATDDSTTHTSATMRLWLGGAAYVEGHSMRGTVDFNFVHGDRVICQFTFTGILNTQVDAAQPTDYTYTAKIPPAWTNTGMEIAPVEAMSANYAGSIFNSMTLSTGNEVVVRENTNSADGYQSAIIQGRTPTLTWNPDAELAATNNDFWSYFLAGTPTRMRWTLGDTTTNKVDFRVSAAQFTGISDGNRDTVEVYDSTTLLTGGNFGSSVISAGGEVQTSKDKGMDNELFILFR